MGGTWWGQKVTGNGRYRDRSKTEKKGLGNEQKKCMADSQRACQKKTEFLKVKPGEQNEKLRECLGIR